MAGFGLPNFGQLTEAFKKAKQIQQDAQKLQDELENMEICLLYTSDAADE